MTVAQVDQFLDRGDDSSHPRDVVDQKSSGQIGLNCFIYIALAKHCWVIKLGEFISDQKFFTR